MIEEPLVDANTYHTQIVKAMEEGRKQGRKEEALRMTRIALTRRFGGLEHTVSLALEQMGCAALEEIALDTTLTAEKLYARVFPATSTEISRERQAFRLSPRGGFH